jgi:uncharacterized protein involved in type VI secretion and phage assembly
MSEKVFHGIYPARVEDIFDPNNTGRIKVSVADVGGSSLLTWADPCLPITGNNMGMFTVPPEGSAVWVQFIRGNSNYPVWLGGRFATGEPPSLAALDKRGLNGIALQSTSGNGLVISDAPGGGILLQTAGGAKIELTDSGITITTGQGATLKLTGATVDINNQALTID